MKEHVIINRDRTVIVPESLKKIGIQFDHNVNTITFDCPRYPDEDSSIDMSQMPIFINYMLPDKTPGSSLALNVTVDETDDTLIHFDWKITNAITPVNGVLSTLICVKQSDTEGNELYHWNTDLFQKFTVGNGMECNGQVAEMNPDVISQLLARMGEVDTRTSAEAMSGYINEYMTENPPQPTDEQASAGINTYMASNGQTHVDAYMTENQKLVQNSVDDYLGRNPLQLDDSLTDSTKAAPADKVGELKGELKSAIDVLAVTNEPINIWNPDGTGYYNRYGTFIEASTAEHMFINVSEGDVFRVYNWTMSDGYLHYLPVNAIRICAYNGDTPLPTIDVASVKSYTVTDGITKLALAVNIAIAPDTLVTLNDATIPEVHQDYFAPYKSVKTDKTLTEANGIADAKTVGEKITDLGEKITDLGAKIGNFEIVMPELVPIVAGKQMNIYNDNIILGDIGHNRYFDFSVNSLATVSKMLLKNLQMNPNTVTTQPARVMIKDKSTAETVASKSFSIKVISELSSSKKVVFIGDSLTDIGYYPAEIEHNLSNGLIVSVGTRSRTVTINNVELTTLNEGRGGWSPTDYVTYPAIKGVTNAFWNPSTSKFDFSYYMQNNGFTGVDCVCIALGTNGVSNADGCVDAISEMITSIHAYNSNIVVLVTLITPGATQDGWGNLNHTASGQTFKHDQMMLIKSYKNAFEDVITNVHVVPWYLNLDTENDFPTSQYALSSRNPTTVTLQNNNVHPSIYGYLKMADVMWACLCYYLA